MAMGLDQDLFWELAEALCSPTTKVGARAGDAKVSLSGTKEKLETRAAAGKLAAVCG